MNTSAQQAFAVTPPPAWAWWLMVGLAGLLPLGLIAVLWLSHVPMHAPPTALLLVPVVTGLLLLAMTRRSVWLHHGILEIRATLYTQKIPVAALDWEHASIVDLAEHTELKPLIKTNGFSTPGLNAGHFRLRKHFGKAFCLITDTRRVLWLPRRDGKGQYLLSLEHPQRLLDSLRTGRH